MTIELRVPEVGESITEVQIGEWLKATGEAVAKDEPLVVIETDKVTVELPAPAAGAVTEVRKQPGETAEVGEVVGLFEPGEAPAEARTPSSDGDGGAAASPASSPDAAPQRAGGREGGHVMPAARRALADAGLAPEDASATGPGGRLLKEDVQRAAAAGRARPVAAEEEVVPMSPLRRRIAERLVQAQQTAAILTTFNEVDMTAVIELRRESQERFRERHGVKLGFMSFFVKAAVEALKRVPQVNAEIRGTDVVYKNHFDIGVAVGGGKGLVVPVLRGAESMGFAEVEAAIADFAERARTNRLGLEELQGGTFTISNGGVYGSLLSTPILNPPQSGILGLHAMQDRPVARDGEVVVRPMMYVALSYDHRIVDGREAVTFLKTVKECVEDPSRILLEI